MERRFAPVATVHAERPETVVDRHWRAHARRALQCALAFVGLLVLLDWGSGGLTPARAGLWALLGAVAFAVLLPARVSAGDGWLAVRGLVGRRQVRTDALVAVRRYGGVAPRLLLRDARGRRLVLDSRVLEANPLIWHLLDAGARRSLALGTLRHGTHALGELADRIDGQEARGVLAASGLL
ncbi:hypothetical protein [Streptomyces noursei]|uniref:hypothetical protein n=1 Tax=Streptomyces noursei TaxID=1971 RepID=UPI001678CB7C|nr:hypothetical protein [Streptomyces noursei]MCZ1013029.1 hypothetical protein [Streptomyces noursei]GGX43187.1 hypothetical protein GCM10010341_76480 [Streptomyces noursei]